MSRINPYGSIPKRTFGAAVIQVLATEYGFLGGQRVRQLVVEDIEALVAEFYPLTERAASGTLIWTCTANEGKKAQVGKPTEEYKTVTVRLPVVEPEDVAARMAGGDQREVGQRRQVARVVKAAHEQGGLLTLAELSTILNLSYGRVMRYVQEWEEQSGELLPLKGYQMDQGSRPTHKAAIIRLYEQGQEPPDIARQTQHALKSVERYLKDYERVRLLLKQGVEEEQLSVLMGRGRQVVLEYVDLAREYHPELFVKTETQQATP